MAKRKTDLPKPRSFKLSGKGAARLNYYLAQIWQGIVSVCELHTHDSNPSLSQADFEGLFIDRVLAQTVTAVSVSLRAMAEGLTTQKEADAQRVKDAAQNNDNTPKGKNKEEDT